MFTFSPFRYKGGSIAIFRANPRMPRQYGGGAKVRGMRSFLGKAKAMVLAEAASLAKSLDPTTIVRLLFQGGKVLQRIKSNPTEALVNVGKTLAKESLRGLSNVVLEKKNPRSAVRQVIANTAIDALQLGKGSGDRVDGKTSSVKRKSEGDVFDDDCRGILLVSNKKKKKKKKKKQETLDIFS